METDTQLFKSFVMIPGINRICYRTVRTSIFLFFLLFGGSCKKIVEIPAPVSSVNQGNVYANDATAIAALTGIYTNIQQSSLPITGNEGLSVFGGLSADELTLYSGVNNPTFIAYYQNTLSQTGVGAEYWAPFYNYIFDCNAAIEGLNDANALTPAVRTQLLGEAKFMRAFFYFYLVNLFGDVPLVTTTNWQTNSQLPRAAKNQVYQQIISDLKDAQGLLSDNYVALDAIHSTTERVRPNKWAATALLARVYLYTGDWSDAQTQASNIINNSSLYSLTTLNNTFLMNSNEAIWQLQPIQQGWNTQDARTFIIPATGPSDVSGPNGYPVYLSPMLLNSFEPGDQRLTNWVGSVTVTGTTYYFPYKYKSVTQGAALTEYLMVFRLGEQYLIRAEAEAQLNQGSSASADLNIIRNRAGLSNYAGLTDKASLLSVIAHERQVELFTEWGHRWLDLKRTGNVDAVMSSVTPLKANGAPWKPYQQLYPIWMIDIQRDQQLTQNSGY